MKTQWPPESPKVFELLEPVRELLWNGLDFGCDQALQYFESIKETEDINPWLASHLTRYHCLRWLAANGLQDTTFQALPLAFSGIWLRSAELDVRVLKIDRRPSPQTKEPTRRIQAQNVSDARRDYYTQPSMTFDTDFVKLDGMIVPPRVKTLALWDTNASRLLTTLELACPKWLDEDKLLVETHWWLPIPRKGQVVLPADMQSGAVILQDIDLIGADEDEDKSAQQ